MSLLVVDTSVWARVRTHDQIAEAIAEAIEANVVAMVPSILLELLRSARSSKELHELREEYGALHWISLTDEMAQRALEVQATLSANGHHRGPSPVDLLTAAAAESIGADLWHCDRHFELISEVTGQTVRRLGR